MAVNYLLSAVGSDVEAFNNYATFRQATADNTTPIPGYLFAEVNAITHENNGSNCGAVVNYFISRLQNNSPLVKLKVLKLLLHVAKNGHHKILQELKVHEIALKKAGNVSGALDGNYDLSFYENVRKYSQDLLSVVFSEEHENYMLESPSGPKSMTALGSEASEKKLPGFGNTPFSQKTFTEKVTDIVDKILSPDDKDDLYKRQATVLAESLPHYNPVNLSKSLTQETYIDVPKPSQARINIQKPVKAHVVGKAGGGWEDSEDDEEEDKDRIIIEEDKEQKQLSDNFVNLTTTESNTDYVVISKWLDEQNLVDSFLTDQSLEEVSWTVLDTTCKKSAELNCEKICEFLVQKLMPNEKDIFKLKCLILIEYLLHYDILSPDAILTIALPNLKELYEEGNNPVQIKAKKIALIVEKLVCQKQSPKLLPEDLLNS